MKKVLMTMAALLLVLAVCSGCETSSSKSFTFDVDTDDSIKIEMDTSGGEYDITSAVPFEITKSDEVVTEGQFLFEEAYTEYVEAVNIDTEATILDSGVTANGNEYVFWTFAEQEFNYVIMVDESQTALLLANDVSRESAEECFQRLTISVDRD